MTRRINKPDGSFGGAVVVSLDPFYFTEFYKELDLGENSSVTLLGLDGVVRARQSGQDTAVGQNVVDSGLVERLSAAQTGTYIAKSVVDGINRVYSYRTLKDYPLAVLVGVDEEVYFATVTQRIKGYYLAVILISLSIVAFTLAMLFVIRRQYFAETKLENMLNGLENQVAERTKELRHKNAELERAYKELQNAQSQVIHQEKMASIGQLAAGVAHEINNPLGFTMSNFETLHKYMANLVEVLAEYRSFRSAALNIVNGSLQKQAEAISTLESKNKLEYILQDMDTIFQETQEGFKRVGDIVKALRIFSRVDHQGQAEDYDLTEGVRNSLIVSRNEVKYIAEVKEDFAKLPLVSAVGGQINQVVLNLILNAAYAVKEKSLATMGLITIRTYFDEKSVYCSIQDNGQGIPEHIKKDIFNPFFTTKPVGQGTGLGLSISYDIITNKHHGEISFNSVEGEGTTFTIRLPRPDSRE
jgi:signal transduction histidine kinase